uniref:Uncharacterized protein n=1 Tax=Timema genevievae TaxID=629358 RepID=A0A7R9K3E2_TIMGE|nr:unnamed protein product [Timema genevievae]
MASLVLTDSSQLTSDSQHLVTVTLLDSSHQLVKDYPKYEKSQDDQTVEQWHVKPKSLLIKIKEWVDKNDPGATIIPFSGAFENKWADMNDDEKKRFQEEVKATSALDKIIVHGYKSLQLQYFFTSGPDEVKAWTIQVSTLAYSLLKIAGIFTPP